MNDINFFDIEAKDIQEVSTNYVYPKGTYALKTKSIEQKNGETVSRIVLKYVIEDVMDVDSTVDITKLVGKEISSSITIWNRTQEDVKDSLGKVKFAIINSGAPKDTAGTLADLAAAAIDKVTWHKVYQKVGKDGITRSDIDWVEYKVKNAD